MILVGSLGERLLYGDFPFSLSFAKRGHRQHREEKGDDGRPMQSDGEHRGNGTRRRRLQRRAPRTSLARHRAKQSKLTKGK